MNGRVSSPASTGGAGTVFEQHVGAYWLAQLLVHAIPPILHDCTITEVQFQTEHLGWHTDDFLIVGQNGAGVIRRLAGQVRRTFTVSAVDEDCKEAFLDFWRDFKKAHPFSRETDRLALVTLRGTNTLLEHFGGLLDCARAARDGAEFEGRLSTPGFLAAKSVQHCDAIRAIIGEAEGKAITAAEVWPFLRVLHVLSVDLQTSTAQTEASIKTQLAYAAGGTDPVGVAGGTWNALIVLASGAMAEARSFRREDLPGDLRDRHSVLGGAEQKALQALKDHSAPVLHGIRSTIGARCRLSRAGLVQDVIDKLQAAQVVVITGAAGSGKSAIAKDVVEQLSKDYFAFSFRAEEFAQPHIDVTLQSGQVPVNAVVLQAILAGQDRKVLLLESAERLLEKSTREAFSDLLRLAAGDKSFQVVLTCRDYSADQVRTSFLATAGIDHAVVEVPRLNDAELKEVEAAYPDLARPLAHPPLRRILRNPYLLDKALQISWAADRPLPESEREFRGLFWQQIVRVDAQPAGGMPRKREEVFEEIAVRRARALTAYIPARDLDAAVIDSLRSDSLIASSDQSAALVAPAHDVLEDWAILQWIEQQHAAKDGSFQELSAVIGTHPALRRSYRKWVAELVERGPGAADRLFRDAVAEGGVPAQFRDDTLISLLQAPSSPEFLARHGAELLANDKALLKRVIHLLRVACVTTPAWLKGLTGHGAIFHVPDGPAWPAVLKLVHDNLGAFDAQESSLLLGLIEDAIRNVSWWAPDLAGAELVAGIAHWILAGFGDYGSEEKRKRTLKVIARIPRADQARFASLLRGTRKKNGRLDRTAEEFREVIFTGIDGIPAARDLPDVVVSVAADYMLVSEKDLRQNPYGGSSLDLDTHFGLRESLRHEFFPASAFRGPWSALLRLHQAKGIDFLLKAFNHSAEWYAHPRVSDPVEPPYEVELKFVDGTTRKQWANPRLWNWYRGTSVGPYALQSLLMALERWLLEVAKDRPQDLDAILLDILRRSDSAALSAVVASIATAFPHSSGETLLVLLSVPAYIALDRQRMATESQAPSTLSAWMPQLRAEAKVYDRERKDADSLPHRRQDLEAAIANLQFGPLAPRVHEILDRHRAVMPPLEQQDDSHRMWRLALHRMDFREYSPAVVTAAEVAPADDASSAAPKTYIRLEPKQPDSDVQEMMDKSAAKFGAMTARLSLLMWGLQVFKHETGKADPSAWHERLIEARAFIEASPDGSEFDGGRNAPGLVAAVSVRDHWEEMSSEKRDWCVDRVCSEIARQSDNWHHLERMQRFDMSADRSCAWVVSRLLGKALTETQRGRVEQAFAAALTHPINEVRWHATWGIAGNLWSVDRGLAIRSVNAIATEAAIIEAARGVEEGRPYNKRRDTDVITAEAAAEVRKRFWQSGDISADACQTLDVSGWFGGEAIGRILAILGEAPADPLTIAVFGRAAESLIGWWDAADDRRRGHGQGRARHFEQETAVSSRIAHLAMRATPAVAEQVLRRIVDAIDGHPREIHTIVQELTGIEDSDPNTEQFWFVWNLFAAGVRKAKWVARLNNEHPLGRDMVHAIFLGTWWRDDVRHWRSLEGNAHHVHALFETLPPSADVLDDYVRFLYHIGEQSLPEAFVRVAQRLQAGDARQMLQGTNTVFMLEVLLRRHVYGRPLELKRDRAVREAVLSLLDVLVENGSSGAFRMRDDFVTPLPAN